MQACPLIGSANRLTMGRKVERLYFTRLLLGGFDLLRRDLPRLIGVAALLPAGMALLAAVADAAISIGGPWGLGMGALEVGDTLVVAVPFVPVHDALALVIGLCNAVAGFASQPLTSLSWELVPVVWGLLVFSAHLLATPLVWAAVIAIAGNLQAGRNASAWDALRAEWATMLPLVRTTLLFCAGAAIYAVVASALSLSYPWQQKPAASTLLYRALAREGAGICGGLVMLPFVLVLPVMVFDRCHGWLAFLGSYRRMRGNLLRGGGAVVASVFLGNLPNQAVGFALNQSGFGRVGVIIGNAVSIAYVSCVLVALYRRVPGDTEERSENSVGEETKDEYAARTTGSEARSAIELSELPEQSPPLRRASRQERHDVGGP